MVQPASKRLVTEAAVAGHVATEITTPGTETATALNATYVRFLDTNGNPVSGDLVTIVVDTVNNEIADIIVEAI